MSTLNPPASPNASKAMAPFSCSFTPQLPELLQQLNCTIALSTFQAGKVILISAKNENELVQLPRTFKKAMGIAIEKNKMAIATKNEVILLKNSKELAFHYPKRSGTYDAMWMPRGTFYSGGVDIHDLHFGKEGELWAINTSFSCLCIINAEHSFTPRWQPHFISKLASEDRCHLNGLAMQNGEPMFVSALGKGDAAQSWRENITSGGILMHIPSNEIILSGLAMPHTPRIYDGKLYCLLSAAEKLICIDPENGTYDEVAHIPGFVRGMAKYDDYLFIATSKLRKNSSTFRHLKIAEKADVASVVVLHLPTGAVVGKLTYHASVDEIYDIQILPEMVRPNIINTYGETHHQALMIPNATFWGRELD